MVTWGKTKKNQSYVKDKPKGMSGSGMQTSPTGDVHMKEKGNREKYRFVVGKGYEFDKDAMVQMNIKGKPISEFDSGKIIGKHGEEEYYYDVKDDKTDEIRMYHISELLPVKEGVTFFKNGKAYKVDINPNYIAVDEMYQDKDNRWHIGKNKAFAQGEDMEYLEKQAGGAYVDTIIEFLDSAGALQ